MNRTSCLLAAILAAAPQAFATDTTTLLLSDNPGAERSKWIYTPHNSGADLYAYLILTAELDPVLRSEVRYTTV